MKEREEDALEPLDPELAALLVAERSDMPAPAALDRVWSRVAGGVIPPGTPPGTTGGGVGHAWFASHAVGVVVATFVVGGLTGAVLHATLTKAPERLVYVDRPTSVASVAPPPAPSPAVPMADVSSLPPVAHPSAHASSSAPSLAAERQPIDAARAALSAGDAAKALALLDDHARRFPRGQLSEEREALAIQALVILGRGDDARARAARFRSTTPQSLFMPAVEQSLSSIP